MTVAEGPHTATISRLRPYLEALDKAVQARQSAQPSVSEAELHDLDKTVCLTARDLFVRFVDVAGWLSATETDAVADACVQKLVPAEQCLQSSAYYEADGIRGSVGEKVRLLSRIANGESLEAVLLEVTETAK